MAKKCVNLAVVTIVAAAVASNALAEESSSKTSPQGGNSGNVNVIAHNRGQSATPQVAQPSARSQSSSMNDATQQAEQARANGAIGPGGVIPGAGIVSARQTGGIQDLGTMPGHPAEINSASKALNSSANPTATSSRITIKTKSPRPIKQELQNRVNSTPRGVSADGSVVVGYQARGSAESKASNSSSGEDSNLAGNSANPTGSNSRITIKTKSTPAVSEPQPIH
jgi:hypothetical protein